MARQDDFTRYTIRVPGELYERVAGAARDAGRSINAEIIARLEATFEFDIDDHGRRLNRLKETFAENERLMSEFEKRLAALENLRASQNTDEKN